MVDIILWIIAFSAGVFCGSVVGKETTTQEKHENVTFDSLRADIVYYTKLTRKLVKENTELRTKQNGNQKTSSKKS